MSDGATLPADAHRAYISKQELARCSVMVEQFIMALQTQFPAYAIAGVLCAGAGDLYAHIFPDENIRRQVVMHAAEIMITGESPAQSDQAEPPDPAGV